MKSKSRKKVYVTHCVDVEGPMEETLEATWERIYLEDGIAIVHEPTVTNLEKLQDVNLELGVDEDMQKYLAAKYSRDNLAYLTTWEEIDEAIKEVTSSEFRQKHADMHGNPYLLNWFIYDHYGFSTNPRFHDDGIHHIWKHYHDLVLTDNKFTDGIYWHYHHPPSSGDALEWNTNIFQNGTYEEILARRVIECHWFPSVFRAGGHIERNDLSFWLEMFIPYDFSARTPKHLSRPHGRGSVNDWRHAPTEWGFYNPDWYDYRRPGGMKRSLFRCLDLKTWITAITSEDVKEAFEKAQAGYDAVLAYYNHDYRNMASEIEYGHTLISQVAKMYPDVEWEYINCLDAARELTGFSATDDESPVFHYEIKDSLLTVTSSTELFGPEPFLAIQEEGRFFRDNMTREGPTEWCYYFRNPEIVKAIGMAGNTAGGKTGVKVYRGPVTGNIRST